MLQSEIYHGHINDNVPFCLLPWLQYERRRFSMMTRTQKTTILEMRAEGITYKTIAEHLGMSLGSVKMFVSRHNRADDRRCEQCGKLLPKGPVQRRGSVPRSARTLGGKRTPASRRGTSNSLAHARFAASRSRPTKIPNTAPVHATTLRCEKSEHGDQAASCRFFFYTPLIEKRQKGDGETAG